MKRNVNRHYIYLDVVRFIAVIAAAAHLMGFLENGWAAVCTLLMFAGYAAARNAFANEKYALWKGLLSAIVRVYIPLAAVAGLVTIAAAKFPQILWLSQKPETASVFFGINNFWQLSAGRDAIMGVFESPFTNMWAAAVLLHFAVLFPFIFIILRWTGRKLGRAVPCWALIFLAAAGFTAFGLLERSGVSVAYLDSFARASAPFLGMSLAFFHHYYGTPAPRFMRGKAAAVLMLLFYTALWVYITVFAADDPVWRFVCGRFGVATSEVFVRTLLITLVSFRLIDYAAVCSETKKKKHVDLDIEDDLKETETPEESSKPAAFGALSLGISYEFYLLITPIVFFAPYVLPAEYEPIRKLVVIVGAAILAGAVMHIAAGLKASAKLKAIRIPLLALCVAAAGYGAYQFTQLTDPAADLAELAFSLRENEAALVMKNNAYEKTVRASEDKWAEVFAGFDKEREAVPGIVRELQLTCLGDSVMVGSTAKIKEMFPNAYVDAKVGDTAYPAVNKLKNLNSKGTMGTHVVLNYGANGDVAESTKVNIMNLIGDRPVYWLTNTFKDRLNLNDVLRAFAENYPNLRVVDWYEYTKDHPEYFVADGLHPTEAGQEAFAQIIYEAISGEYFAEIQGREDEQRELYEAERAERICFIGNDLLIGAFSDISKYFGSAGYISINDGRLAELAEKSSGYAVLKTRLQAAIEDGSLPHRIVLLFDNMAGISAEEYKELTELLSGRELHIVSLYGLLMASPKSRSTENIPAGQLNGLNDVDVIEFCAADSQDDFLCADRIHLTGTGSAALAKLLAERLGN